MVLIGGIIMATAQKKDVVNNRKRIVELENEVKKLVKQIVDLIKANGLK